MVPQRGERRELMDLAARNAADVLAREQARWLADEGKTLAALEELAGALALPTPPLRIECYDISTFQGTNTVGSMVVFEEGRPRSGEYRRFRVKTVEGTDDFASHREVLRRRFYRALEAEEGVAEELRWRLPDLVVIDGGLGQVNVAREVLDRWVCTTCPRSALPRSARRSSCQASTSRWSCLPTRKRSICSSACVTKRTDLRSLTTAICVPRQQTRSMLDEVPGVGPARKRALLRVFGSTKQMKGATVDQIAAVPGISRGLAERIYDGLKT